MPLRVLVLTPDTNLGDLLRRALVDADGCQVVLAQNNHQASRLARQVVFDLAILDESTPDESLPELRRSLLGYQPQLKLVSWQPQAGLLAANASLGLPADVKAVLRSVDAAMNTSAPVHAAADRTAPSRQPPASPTHEDSSSWMLDPGHTEARLRAIPLPGLIYAAVVVRRESLWAYRGSLPRADAGELARLLASSWSREQDPNGGASRAGGDMLRFVHLGAAQEFLLYARGLRYGLVIGLAFPPTTPFNGARSMMEQVLGQFLAETAPRADHDLQPAATPRDHGRSPEGWSAAAGEADSLAGSIGGEAQEVDLPSLDALLGEVPAPTPESMRRSVPEARPVAWSWEIEAGDFPEPVQDWVKPVQKNGGFHSSQPACTFVLTPRRRQHMLNDEVATQLFNWLSELAYARGWRLEGVSVRPDYLKFTAVQVNGETSASVLQAVRQHTTQNLLAAYPNLLNEHPMDDYWAENCLEATPDRPLSAQDLRHYLLRAGRQPTGAARNTNHQITPR